MHHIEEIVERVSGALGPAADPAKVEAVASSLLEMKGTASVFTGSGLRISLSDCSSLLVKTVRSRAYDKIRRIASHLESALREAGLGGTRHIDTTPITQIAGKATASDLIVLARMLDDAAGDCSASEITGLTACSDRRIDPVAAALLGIISEVLQATTRVVVDVRAASIAAGVNVDAVANVIAASRRYSGMREDLLRLRLSAGRMSVPPAADASLFLRADAATMIHEALRSAPESPIHDISGILTATAFGLGRSKAPAGDAAAAVLSERSGFDVRFGGIEVEPGAGLMNDRTLSAAFAEALKEGFRAAVCGAHVLPQRFLAAFSSATTDGAAGARVVDELARSSHGAVAVHTLFSDRPAGELIHLGPFHDVRVEEPSEPDWFRRGGQISGERSSRS